MSTCIILIPRCLHCLGQVADIPLDHPSCSQQHAVIQYRLMPYEKSDGTMGRRIRYNLQHVALCVKGNGLRVLQVMLRRCRRRQLASRLIYRRGGVKCEP